jgi:hypothetical protein
VPPPTSSWVPLVLASSVWSWLPLLCRRAAMENSVDHRLIQLGLPRNMFSGGILKRLLVSSMTATAFFSLV